MIVGIDKFLVVGGGRQQCSDIVEAVFTRQTLRQDG